MASDNNNLYYNGKKKPPTYQLVSIVDDYDYHYNHDLNNDVKKNYLFDSNECKVNLITTSNTTSSSAKTTHSTNNNNNNNNENYNCNFSNYNCNNIKNKYFETNSNDNKSTSSPSTFMTNNHPKSSLNRIYDAAEITNSVVVENLSPIKPTFYKDECSSSNYINFTLNTAARQQQEQQEKKQIIQQPPTSDGDQQMQQFTHSTPNHYSNSTSLVKAIPILVTNNKSTALTDDVNAGKNEQISKKQLIVKEIAVNILELNGYKTRTEQLDNELKSFNHLRTEINLDQSSRDYLSLTQKTEGIQTELEKLKSEMLQKIDDIHNLETELIKLEDGNNSAFKATTTTTTTTTNRPAAQTTTTATSVGSNRNEEVMNEIRNVLKEMISSEAGSSHGQASNLMNVNKIYEEYSKTVRRNVHSPSVVKSRNDTNQAEIEYIYKRFDTFQIQIEREFNSLLTQANMIEQNLSNFKTVVNKLNEVEKFKHHVKAVMDNLEKEKFYLYKNFHGLNNQTSRMIINDLADNVEKVLYDRQAELDSIVNGLYSIVEKDKVVLQRESSFLTDEEEAIKLISEKIHRLSDKIDSSDEADQHQREQIEQLNEQIRLIKSKMIVKGNKLTPCSGPIYLPINHVKKSAYRVESTESYKQTTQMDESFVCYETHATKRRDNRNRKKSCSPEKKYTSSVEIPAEQLENFKKCDVKKSRCTLRRKSESVSSLSSSVSRSSREKKRPAEDNVNFLSVSLRTLKIPQPDKQTMTEETYFKEKEKFALDLAEMKRQLDEKNEIIARMQEQHRQLGDLKSNELMILTKKCENLNSVIENQRDEISGLKNKLNDMIKSETQRLENEAERAKTTKAKKFTETYSQTVEPSESASFVEASMLCNIPEHHKLEDMVHEYKNQIANLKIYLRDLESRRATLAESERLELLERRAEFEALDLAINQRKQQLFNLEMAKNRAKSKPSVNSSDEHLLKDEIKCLEITLRKRNLELQNIESLIRCRKRDLNLIQEKKNQFESELECMMKKNAQLTKEATMVDKKADEATVELIVAKEELERLREEKKTLEKSMETMKVELMEYVKTAKRHSNPGMIVPNGPAYSDVAISSLFKTRLSENIAYETNLTELKETINENKLILQSLNSDIYARKREIDQLKEKSAKYTDEFKSEVKTYQSDINTLKSQRETLVSQIKLIKSKLDEANNDLAYKRDALDKQTSELERVDKQRQLEEGKLNELEANVDNKRAEFQSLEANLEKLIENYQLLRDSESQLAKKIEKQNADYKSDNQSCEQLKKLLAELNEAKNELESQLDAMSNDLNKLNENILVKEQQLNKLNGSIKDRQMALKRAEEDLKELNEEKENLNGELNHMDDKVKRKKIEMDKLDEAYKKCESKFESQQSEAKTLVDKLNDTKSELENLKHGVRENESKLKELSGKYENKRKVFDQLNQKLAEKKEEFEQLEAYLDEIKNECQNEKRNLNLIQNEYSKQKKYYDELKLKFSSLNKSYEDSELKSKSIKELEDELGSKEDYIIELETKLSKKSHELENLSESYKKSQEEMNRFKIKLIDLEEKLSGSEKFFYESHFSEECINEPAPKTLVSSLLITPSIKKSSSNLIDYCSGKKKLENAHLEEQNRLRKTLMANFDDRMRNLEKSKMQTKHMIDSLKLNLNDIELKTANNIFKITSQS